MRHLTDEELLLDFYDEGTAVDRTRVRLTSSTASSVVPSTRSYAAC